MITRTILLGLLVAGGCRTSSADTANPGDQPAAPASKAPSEDDDVPMPLADIDMDEYRNDGSEPISSTPSTDEDVVIDDDEEDYEDYGDEEDYEEYEGGV